MTTILTGTSKVLYGLAKDPWRSSILGALPVAVCAYLVALWLEGPSGQGSSFDYVSYPLIAATFVALGVLLLTRRLSTAAVIMAITTVVYLQLIGKLVYLLYFNPRPALVHAEFTETFFWLPVLFVLGAFVPGMRRGRVVVGTFFALLVALSAGYALPNALAGQNFGVLYALFEMLLANVTLLALTYQFIGFKESLAKTSARAETLERLAYHDPLTELPNRLALEQRLGERIAGCRDGHNVAVAFIDLDDFKLVNDLHGHAAGDRLLNAVARRLDGARQGGDAVFRVSGDEFVMLLTGPPGEVGAQRVGERVRRALAEPLEVGGKRLGVSASVGITLFPDDGADAATLLKHADAAMYTVKHRGKDGVALYHAGSDRALEERALLLSELRRAVRAQAFTLHYQPIVDLETNKTVKLEALLRWESPALGEVSPGTFVPLAEAHGLIGPLGTYALKAACAQLARWAQGGLENVVVNVNVSARQLQDPAFAGLVETVLKEANVAPHRLELELTESSVIGALDQVAANLRALRRLGVAVALDDFGTGYSSLSYLETLDFDTIKLDRSFATKLTQSRHSPQYSVAIVRAVLEIADTLGAEVVAEGIETREQLGFFQALGCRLVQGYYLSRPLPAEQLTPFLQTPTGTEAGAELARSVN